MNQHLIRRTARLAALGLLAAGTAAGAQTYRQAVAATNPIASFQLDAANVGSTNGLYTTSWQNVTTGGGAPLASVPGNIGAVFDGTGATSIVTTSLTGNTPGRGSINLWVKLASLASTAGRTFFLAGESEFANDFDFQLSQADRLSLCVGAGQCFEAGGVDASWVGQWHMVTAAYDGTINGGLDTQSIFIDGVLAATRLTELSDAAHTSAFTLGYSSVFGGRELAGTLDEVAVYNRALSAGEVAGLYAARLNGGGGTTPAVPEPSTWALMLLGFAAVGAMLRRPRRIPAVAG